MSSPETLKLTDLERLAVRERPEGQPLMHQTWGKLLFMHWRIDAQQLRALIPEPLEIDEFDGTPWIAIAPFTMWDIRAFPPFIPPIPGLNSAHELNVRTYVHYDRVPGVWFFSLDCNSAAAVLGARTFFHLPYFNANIDLKQEDNTIDYSLSRTDAPPADFDASWRIGDTVPFSHPGSLAFFLTERYCLYSKDAGQLYRSRIHHQPWPLKKAQLLSFDSTIIESLDLPTPQGEPLLHYCEELSVEIWSLENAGGSRQ
ncbi:MAG: YqjF family protein [Pyrinomonadaceae bacterium]